MKLTTKLFLVIIVSLIHYLVMEYLNGGNYFDFTNNKIYGKLTISLIVALALQLLIKPDKQKNKKSP